jgi:hypothetical protein
METVIPAGMCWSSRTGLTRSLNRGAGFHRHKKHFSFDVQDRRENFVAYKNPLATEPQPEILLAVGHSWSEQLWHCAPTNSPKGARHGQEHGSIAFINLHICFPEKYRTYQCTAWRNGGVDPEKSRVAAAAASSRCSLSAPIQKSPQLRTKRRKAFFPEQKQCVSQ